MIPVLLFPCTWDFHTTAPINWLFYILTLNAPMATKVVCFSRLLEYLRGLYGKQCGPDQTAPIGA